MNATFQQYIQTAYNNGRTIQYRRKTNKANRWSDIPVGGKVYFSDLYDYRVKPTGQCHGEQVEAAWLNGATVQFRMGEGSVWRDAVTPTFAACLEWRVKPDPVTITPRPVTDLNEVQRAWREGKAVQFFGPLSEEWIDTDKPNFSASVEWRVKPEAPTTPSHTTEWSLIWSLNGQVAKLRGELAREKEKVEALQRVLTSRSADLAKTDDLKREITTAANNLDSIASTLIALGKGA